MQRQEFHSCRSGVWSGVQRLFRPADAGSAPRRSETHFPVGSDPGVQEPPVAAGQRHRALFYLALFGSLFCAANAGFADSMTPEQRAFFETKIRPVLVRECYECHANGAKKIGGKLRLDSKREMQQGGESGPSMHPGDPDASLLIQALRYDGAEMPPKKKLPDAVIEDFARWVKMGAPDPRDEDPSASKKLVRTDERTADLWSLKPIRNPEVPSDVWAEWGSDPLDRFVAQKMGASGLKPAPDAEPRVLFRRLLFDLHGLPPAFEQAEAFESEYRASGPGVLGAWVDRLLDSPRFGERWGRHWMDVARYAESNGDDGLGRNPNFPHAWRYRDYVIESFNRNVPYDRFVREQIAGDLISSGSPEARDRGRVATGFLALCAKPALAMNDANFPMDVVADQIGVIGSGILGLSVGCARCHDHKHDPISIREYTALAGILRSTQTLWGAAGFEPLSAMETPLHRLEAVPVHLVPPAEQLPQPGPKFKKRPIEGRFKYPPGAPLAMGVRDAEFAGNIRVNLGGEASRLGEEVMRGVPGWFGPTSFADQLACPPRSGREELADWLVRDAQPLTARVFVNRVWQHLFGEGLVRTPDDFGEFGDRPVNPELLDHLATRFIRSGWDIKGLIRAMVLSRTYRLSSVKGSEAAQKDPENRFLSFHPRRRLDAESLRDAMLAASGRLELQPPSGSRLQHQNVLVNEMNNLHRPDPHRSVYQLMLRNAMPPELLAFNLPDGLKTKGKRDETTIPGQALFLLNNPFVIEQSQHLAARVAPRAGSPEEGARLIFRSALSRNPTPSEIRQAVEFLSGMESELAAAQPGTETSLAEAYARLAQAVLASNEMRYID